MSIQLRAPDDSPRWLYRMRDKDGRLLYIGISTSAPRRWMQHDLDKWWAESACTFERVKFPDLRSARAAERAAIEVEAPMHNVLFNGRVLAQR